MFFQLIKGFQQKKKNAVKRVFRRNFRGYDKLLFQERLNKLDWSIIYELNNVNEMWDMVLMVLHMRPIEFVRTNGVTSNRHVWYNSSLDSIAVERDKLFRAFIKSNKKKPELYLLALEKRKEHNRAVKKCKEDFF